MQKIKVLHITSSLKIGGAEAVLCDLIKNLDNTRFEHHVIYFHAGAHVETLAKYGVRTYHIRGVLSLLDPFFMFRLYRMVKKINPAVIHTLLWAANVSGRLIGKILTIPVMSAFHNNVDQDGRFRAFFDRATLPMAHKLIAVSDGVADSVRLRDPWLLSNSITVIQNGIDVVELRARNTQEAVSRKILGLSDTDYIIGSVGRFVSVKRYDLLIAAFAIVHRHYNHSKLVLVGTGPLEVVLKQQAQELGLCKAIIFVVEQPAYRYYTLFDCFVQSSDKEGISIALLEAMSFGVSCIVTTMHEHAVITHLYTGILVPAGMEHELAHAIIQLMLNITLRQSLGQAGQGHIQGKFTIEHMIQSYDALFCQKNP